MVKPWFLLKPQLAHDLGQAALPYYASLFGIEKTPYYQSFYWNNLHFKNPMGIAGGVDKTGANLLSWQKMGAGFLELGTVTPRQQGPNPGTIMDRSLSEKSLWNKMGFPNPGANLVLKRLVYLRHKIEVPLFINIGKNRDTDQQSAGNDYADLFRKFDDLADVFVINISSPNTKGLRGLLKPEQLKSFLASVFSKGQPNKPWLLKLSPNISEEELYRIIDLSLDFGCKGFTLTNTLQNEPNFYPQHQGGGVSGAPLKRQAENLLNLTTEYLTKRSMSDSLIVSVGGIEDAKDIQRRLDSGASLVQAYSSLVFTGPQFFIKNLRILERMATWQSKEKSDHSGYPSSPAF